MPCGGGRCGCARGLRHDHLRPLIRGRFPGGQRRRPRTQRRSVGEKQEDAEIQHDGEILAGIEAQKHEEAAAQAAKRTEKIAAAKAKKREEAAAKAIARKEQLAEEKLKKREAAVNAELKKQREEIKKLEAAKKPKATTGAKEVQSTGKETTPGKAGNAKE